MQAMTDQSLFEKFFHNLYDQSIVVERMDEIIQLCREMSNLEEMNNKITLRQQLFSPRFKIATQLGCFLSFSQQMTGINTIFDYSQRLYRELIKDSNLTPQSFNMGMGIVNLGAGVVGVLLLCYFGRRAVMLTFTTCLVIT